MSDTPVSFSIDDPSNLFGGYVDVILTNLEYAWSQWDQYLDAAQGASIELVIRPSTDTDYLASAGALGTRHLYGDVWQGSVSYELITGNDANGSQYDGEIVIALDYLSDRGESTSPTLYQFDPYGITANDQISFAEVMVHELAHILGINGWFDGQTFSPYEEYVDTVNNWFYGDNAVEVYGGYVPLDGDSLPHLNPDVFPDDPFSTYASYGGGQAISELDLAILTDIGLPIVDPDDDGGNLSIAPTLSVSVISAVEGESQVQFVLERAGVLFNDSSVAYSLSSRSAQAGVDFDDVSGVATFEGDDTVVTITVDVYDDAWAEGIETFGLLLSDAFNLKLPTSTTTATISDEDSVSDQETVFLSLSSTATTVEEGTDLTLTLNLTDSSGNPLVVSDNQIVLLNYGGSTSTGDWSGGNRLIVDAGESSAEVVLTITNDELEEGSETLDISVLSADGFELFDVTNGDDRLRVTVVDSVERVEGSAADDVFFSTEGSWFDGLAGLDTLNISGSVANALISAGQIAEFSVSVGSATYDLDSVERLVFDDGAIALDLEGDAGLVVMLLGAVFGADAVDNREYAGIGLDVLEGGLSDTELAELALNAAGLKDPESIVTALYSNLVGQGPSSSELNHYVSLLENSMSEAELTLFAAEHSLNLNNIDFVGLEQSGLHYLPVDG